MVLSACARASWRVSSTPVPATLIRTDAGTAARSITIRHAAATRSARCSAPASEVSGSRIWNRRIGNTGDEVRRARESGGSRERWDRRASGATGRRTGRTCRPSARRWPRPPVAGSGRRGRSRAPSPHSTRVARECCAGPRPGARPASCRQGVRWGQVAQRCGRGEHRDLRGTPRWTPRSVRRRGSEGRSGVRGSTRTWPMASELVQGRAGRTKCPVWSAPRLRSISTQVVVGIGCAAYDCARSQPQRASRRGFIR